MGSEIDEAQELLRRIEGDVSTPIYRRAAQFGEAAQLLARGGDEGRALQMQTLAVAFNFHRIGRVSQDAQRPGRRFGPMMVTPQGRSPIPEDFTPEQWETVMAFRDATKNPVLRAHLSDVLWDGRKDAASAREAIDCYLSAASHQLSEGGSNVGMDIADALDRAINVSVALNDKERQRLAVEEALAAARSIAKSGNPRWALEIIGSLLDCRKVKGLLPLDELQSMIEGIVATITGDENQAMKRHWLQALQQVGMVKGDPELVRAARISIAETFVEEAEGPRGAASALIASVFYKDAIQAFKKAGGCAERVTVLLGKLEASVTASQSEMKRVEAPLSIPKDQWSRWRNEVQSLAKQYGVLLLAHPDYALPNAAEIRESVRAAQQQFPPQSIFPTQVSAGERIIAQASSPEEHEELEFVRYFMLHLSVKTAHIARWTVEALGSPSEVQESFVGRLSGSLAHPGRHPMIERAISRYCEGDYISAVALLACQLEGMVRDIASAIPIPFTTEREGITQLRYLGDLLADPKMKALLGENRTVALRLLLNEQTGLNARNRVAHAEPTPDIYTQEVADLLMVLLAQLMGWQKETPAEGTDDVEEDGGPLT